MLSPACVARAPPPAKVRPETNPRRRAAAAPLRELASELQPIVQAKRRGSRPTFDFVCQLFPHRRHRLRGNSARHDQVEVAKVGIDIQSKSVRSHGAGNMHPDRRNLFFDNSAFDNGAFDNSGRRLRFGPNSRHPRHAPRRNAKISAGANQHFLQPSNIIDRAESLSPHRRFFGCRVGSFFLTPET